jgi:hypothetical protein
MLRKQGFEFRKKSRRFRVIRSRRSLAEFPDAIFNVMNFHRSRS